MTKTIIKFLGHTTVLIKTEKTQILIDPNFSSRIPFLKRLESNTIDHEELFKTQAVFFSNAHYNRLDHFSLKYFPQKTTKVYLPKGTQNIVSKFYHFDVLELNDNETLTIEDIKITSFYSQHSVFRFSGLYPGSVHYVIDLPDGKSIFYGSDMTFQENFFSNIGKSRAFDLVVLPLSHVGPTFTKRNFLEQKDVIEAFKLLGAKKLLPNAYGSFSWNHNNSETILSGFKEKLSEQKLSDIILPLKTGEEFSL